MRGTLIPDPVTLTPAELVGPDEHSLAMDDEQFRVYVALEVERRKSEDSGTYPGLRLSTECPVRRVKAGFEPTRYAIPIDPGVAARGHEMESRFRACLPWVIDDPQVPIPWGLGTSAFDGIAASGKPVELKSSIHDKKPSSANKSQGDRMLTMFGFKPGATIEFWMTDPSTLTARGPYIHTLTAEAHAKALAEREGVKAAYRASYNHMAAVKSLMEWEAWSTPEWWATFGLACSCGGCLFHGHMKPDAALEALASTWASAKRQSVAVEASIEDARDALIEAVKTRADASGEPPKVKTYGEPVSIAQRKDGAWVVKTYKL